MQLSTEKGKLRLQIKVLMSTEKLQDYFSPCKLYLKVTSDAII